MDLKPVFETARSLHEGVTSTVLRTQSRKTEQHDFVQLPVEGI